MSRKTIQATKNYRLFERHSGENRPLDLRKHKKLMDSMKLYGFLPCFPIVTVRNEDGNLIVKDGQHRLLIAEELELPVYWVEETIDFDVAVVNSTAKVWALRDYAQKHATNGLKAYSEGLEFAEAHSLPIGIAFALLSGTTTFGNCEEAFISGKWRVMDRECGETIFADGFVTKWEAVAALGKYLDEEKKSPEKQMPQLIGSMETYEKHRVECWQCSAADSERDISKDDYAKILYERGWRYVLSKKYATEGTVCPECVKELAEEGE